MRIRVYINGYATGYSSQGGDFIQFKDQEQAKEFAAKVLAEAKREEGCEN